LRKSRSSEPLRELQAQKAVASYPLRIRRAGFAESIR
jgi:hypothetical protein